MYTASAHIVHVQQDTPTKHGTKQLLLACMHAVNVKKKLYLKAYTSQTFTLILIKRHKKQRRKRRNEKVQRMLI